MANPLNMKFCFCLLSVYILLLLLTGCSDETSAPKPSTYLIVNRLNYRPNISLYDHATEMLDESVFGVSSTYPTPLITSNRKGDHLYLFTASPDLLRKIDLAGMTEVSAVPTALEGDYYAGESFIDFGSSSLTLVVPIWKEDSDEPFVAIKTYDETMMETDSIGINGFSQLRASKQIDNKVYVSGVDALGWCINVVDLSSREVVKRIALNQSCSDLIDMGAGRLLAVTGSKQFLINSTTGEIEKELSFQSMTHPTLGRSENTVYYLYEMAQPAMVPYLLAEANVSTGEWKLVSDVTANEAMSPPILYDKANKLIVTSGTQNGIKLFKTDGTLEKSVETPSRTLHLFIK